MRWLRTTLLGCAVVSLLCHFSIVVLDQLPPNPIFIHVHPIIKQYMHPYWVQTWKLFAPNPVSTDNAILYSFTITCGIDTLQTNWVDASEALIQDRARTIWTNSQRIQKIMHSSMIEINKLYGDLQSDSLLTTFPNLDDDCYVKQFDTCRATAIFSTIVPTCADSIVRAGIGYKAITRYGVYVYEALQPDSCGSRQLLAVHSKLVTSIFPRFSKRLADNYDSLYRHEVLTLPTYLYYRQ